TTLSTMDCSRPGTPAVARRAKNTNNSMNTSEATTVNTRVSMLRVQKGLSPSDTCQFCRWCWMYPVMSAEAACSLAMSLPDCNEGDPKRELRRRNPGDQPRERQVPHGYGEVQ